MAPITAMTVGAIRNRLADITLADQAFAARDLDSEMSAVMRAGGDVDAMETTILEAERLARRLRAERAALEGELPQALKREGDKKLAELVARYGHLSLDGSKAADSLCAAWRALIKAAEEWAGLQDHAVRLTQEASGISTRTGAEMPALGLFNRRDVGDLLNEYDHAEMLLRRAFASASRAADLGAQGLHRKVLD